MSPEDKTANVACYEDLKNHPSTVRLANMPEDIYQLYKKTDPLRAAIVDDCRAIVSGKEKPVNERIKISDLKNDPSVIRLANMPEDLFGILEGTDQLRAQIVKDCRAIVFGNGKTNPA